MNSINISKGDYIIVSIFMTSDEECYKEYMDGNFHKPKIVKSRKEAYLYLKDMFSKDFSNHTWDTVYYVDDNFHIQTMYDEFGEDEIYPLGIKKNRIL